MLKKTNIKGYVLLIFFIFFLCLTLFGGSGISLAIKGVSPILVLSLLVPFASFFSPVVSAVMGFLCGAVLDSISADSYCFNSLCLLLLSFLANYLAHAIFNRNLRASISLCFLVTLLYHIFYWLLFIAFSISFSDNLRYLLQTALPSCVYTAVISALFYFVFDKLSEKFN